MTLRRRLDKLECKRSDAGETVKGIIREIVLPDGSVVAFHGCALGPSGWNTIMCGADMGREAFEAKLWAMVKDGRA